MAESNQERVTCPSCGKGYRWQAALTGREVPCKHCGTAFIIPDQPGVGLSIEPSEPEDDGLYDLASDPDEERELPPAYVVEKTARDPSAATPSIETSESAATVTLDEPSEPADTGEPQVHISEAAKAARREEQRIAAANEVPEKSWRDYKWLIILIAVLLLFSCIWLAMDRFGDFVDDPTKQSFHIEQYNSLVAMQTNNRGEQR